MRRLVLELRWIHSITNNLKVDQFMHARARVAPFALAYVIHDDPRGFIILSVHVLSFQTWTNYLLEYKNTIHSLALLESLFIKWPTFVQGFLMKKSYAKSLVSVNIMVSGCYL
jgi:hypothetical protein